MQSSGASLYTICRICRILRSDLRCPALLLTGHGTSTNFYSYANFLRAAASFPSFAASSDATTNKRELAAFLAHISHETGGLCWITEGVWGHQPAVEVWHSMRQAWHAALASVYWISTWCCLHRCMHVQFETFPVQCTCRCLLAASTVTGSLQVVDMTGQHCPRLYSVVPLPRTLML